MVTLGIRIIGQRWKTNEESTRIVLNQTLGKICRKLAKWSVLEATKDVVVRRKLLKGLVGACGFEPQTPTMSRPFTQRTSLIIGHFLNKRASPDQFQEESC